MKRLPPLVLGAALALAACQGSDTSSPAPGAVDSVALSGADVERILAQGVAEATARGLAATFAVTDRVGNVLAVYQMPGAGTTVDIDSGLGVSGGLDGLAGTIPATLAAISKAVTGAYLSSSGNAFSTRTASQIVQDHFNPGEQDQPSGPLFGVQFSQLPCSDLVRRDTDGDTGPKHAPLGLAADPGGLPLYKDGVVVGGIGVMADGRYGLDRVITDTDTDADELVAVAASTGFRAPADIRANRITADGRTLRYVDAEAIRSNPAAADPLLLLAPANYLAVTGYTAGTLRAGATYGTAASGVMPHDSLPGAWMLSDSAGVDRYPPRDSLAPATTANGMTQAEVTQLLQSALGVAAQARAQIRRPLGSTAQVSIAVVDTGGNILGFARTTDAPLFGADVAVQKARTASFFSGVTAASTLQSLPDAGYVGGGTVSLADYVFAARSFFDAPALFTGNVAFSARAIGNVHRPTFPDGPATTPAGPLSKAAAQWSPFNVGLQLDLVYNQLVQSVVASDFSVGCTGTPALANGIQIFPGGVPLYRGNQLVGAIGVSGDGVDQDDMIALLGTARARAAQVAGGSSAPVGNAPAALRADQLAPQGVRLRYAQCPQSPFLDGSIQNVCAGL